MVKDEPSPWIHDEDRHSTKWQSSPEGSRKQRTYATQQNYIQLE